MKLRKSPLTPPLIKEGTGGLGMSRREFLKVLRKTQGVPVIDKKRCTGCGLCALDCETKALVVNQVRGNETYQLLFRKEACNACRVCQEVCPEHCLRWIEKEPEKDTEEGAKIIFEDEMSRCDRCGIPLFPRSMVEKLEPKIREDNKTIAPLSICPSCRIETEFGKALAGRNPWSKG